MKVLFANPPWWEGWDFKAGVLPTHRAGVRCGSRWPFTYRTFSFPGWRMPFEYLPMPFFLTSAAGYVAQDAGIEVEVRDSIARRESYAAFFRRVREGRYDYLFLESASPCWPHDRALIERIHRMAPRLRIVVCGPVGVERCGEIIGELPVHACILGEYEQGAAEVLGGRAGRIDYRLLSPEEMNRAPWPRYDEAVATRYYDRNPRGVRRPQAQVWASRGCPFKCIFCVWPATMTGQDPDGTGRRSVRYYEPGYLEPLLRHLLHRYRYRSVYFDDDTFNLGNRHTLAVCEVMRKLEVPWSAMCRTDTIRLETWEVMRRSGCYGVKLGFESGNQEVVDRIVNKSLDLAHGAEVVRHLKRLGFTVHGTFTIGLPGETSEQMRETLAFAESLPFDSKQVSGAAEIEGTPLHRLMREGTLPAFDGMRRDEGFDRIGDGNRKRESLVRRLRDE